MEIPRLGIKLELQWQATTTATEMPDPSWVFNLHHSSLQLRVLNPLSKARNWTHELMDTSLEFVTSEPQWELSEILAIRIFPLSKN